jgi:hypothetical protein
MIAIHKTDIFVKWLDSLKDIRARSGILARIKRLVSGNPGDVKPVGEGVSELRIKITGQVIESIINNKATPWLFYWQVAVSKANPKI